MRKSASGAFLFRLKTELQRGKSFTWSFSMWDVLASLCCELGAAGELGAGSGWVLVPAVWTLEVFSRTIGGLLWKQKGPFRANRSEFWLYAGVYPHLSGSYGFSSSQLAAGWSGSLISAPDALDSSSEMLKPPPPNCLIFISHYKEDLKVV